MDRSAKRIVKANLLAGLLPGVIAPIVWPMVVLRMKMDFPILSVYPAAAIGISIFAVAVGLIACGIVGVPTLLYLEKQQLNKPPLVAVLGFSFACCMFYVAGPDEEHASLWPVYAYLGVLGASCGFAASYLSLCNRSSRPDAVSRAPGL